MDNSLLFVAQPCGMTYKSTMNISKTNWKKKKKSVEKGFDANMSEKFSAGSERYKVSFPEELRRLVVLTQHDYDWKGNPDLD